jgi:hypothetical protein
MLRVTVELLPRGRESGKRLIATADIGRVRDGALADYAVFLREGLLGAVGSVAFVHGYPRWSASVWDLVARAVAAGLNGGHEALPPRPVLPEVLVHIEEDSGRRYVRLSEIPEPTRSYFSRNIAHSGMPLPGCAWAHDWHDFLEGQR